MAKIPNLDGEYESRDGRIHIIVNRKEITFEISSPEPSKVHIIEDEDERPRQKKKSDTKDRMEKIADGINGINKIMFG